MSADGSDREPPKSNRRKFLVAAGGGLATFVAGAVADRFIGRPFEGLADQVWDGILGAASSPHRWSVADVFTCWPSIQMVAGRSHPGRGFHPDVFAAQLALAPFLPIAGCSEALPLDALGAPRLDRDMLLIGGPVSNSLSAAWRGYRWESAMRLALPDGPRRGLRWEFHYAGDQSGSIVIREDELPTRDRVRRYVEGEIAGSAPKAIRDVTRSALYPAVHPGVGDDCFLTHDHLLISYINNTFSDASDAMLIDVADLHGVGDQAFALVIGDEDLRQELAHATRDRGWRAFQAVYQVPVHHDHKARRSWPGRPVLVDAAEIT